MEAKQNVADYPRHETPIEKLEGLLAEGQRLCVILGATDTGKTTLAFGLGRRVVARGRRVALVDADVGQSDIGPPTTIGWAFVGDASGEAPPIKPRGLYFVGATSPAGHLLPMVVGTRKMADAGRAAGADVVLVDTTGMVASDAGRALKYWKIDLLSPTDIVAVQREAEIEHLLRPWEGRSGLTIHRVRATHQARVRSAQERAERRRATFAEHFAAAREVELALGEIAVVGADLDAPPLPAAVRAYAEGALGAPVIAALDAGDHLAFFVTTAPPARALRLLDEGLADDATEVIVVGDLIGRLLGLCDRSGSLLALGVLRQVDLRARRLTVWTAVRDPAQVALVQVGDCRLSENDL